MNCLVPDGGCFIRACDQGVMRSLNDTEYGEFLVALESMPWARLNKPASASDCFLCGQRPDASLVLTSRKREKA
jgi:hypothetical protein